MEKLASRHAIQELMSWISLMENIIGEDQDRISSAVGSERVQDFLQKYKVTTDQTRPSGRLLVTGQDPLLKATFSHAHLL